MKYSHVHAFLGSGYYPQHEKFNRLSYQNNLNESIHAIGIVSAK